MSKGLETGADSPKKGQGELGGQKAKTRGERKASRSRWSVVLEATDIDKCAQSFVQFVAEVDERAGDARKLKSVEGEKVSACSKAARPRLADRSSVATAAGMLPYAIPLEATEAIPRGSRRARSATGGVIARLVFVSGLAHLLAPSPDSSQCSSVRDAETPSRGKRERKSPDLEEQG